MHPGLKCVHSVYRTWYWEVKRFSVCDADRLGSHYAEGGDLPILAESKTIAEDLTDESQRSTVRQFVKGASGVWTNLRNRANVDRVASSAPMKFIPRCVI